MSVRDLDTHRSMPVSNWRICFDQQGRGTQTITLESGRTCTGSLEARFEGDRMVTRAPRCEGPRFWFVRSEQHCTRVSDAEAHCVERDLEGPWQGQDTAESTFRR